MPSPARPLSLLAVVFACAAGCASDDPPVTPPPADTGTLVFPLIQTGPGGEVFHLAHATFDVAGISNSFTATVDGGGFDPVASVVAPPGLVNVTLRDGWTLERSLDGGATFQPVSALLASPNPNVARVLVNVPSSIEFDFIVRDPSGTLQIKLAVITAPRELAGGILIQDASEDLADYARSPNRSFDFGVFYDLFTLESQILGDGTHQHVYTANHVAVEYYNDRLGRFASEVGPELSGGFLTYTVAARPDGTVELSGELLGGNADHFTDIVFGPNNIDAISSPGIGADGFPVDEFFYDSELPFTQNVDFGTVSGVLRMRHLIPGQPGRTQ